MASSTSGKSGGWPVAGAALLVMTMLAALARVWVLMAVLAVAFGVGAYAYKRKTDHVFDQPDRVETYYTQTCPRCGGQAKAGVHSYNAWCPYCGAVLAAEREPLPWPDPPDNSAEQQRVLNRFRMLVVAAVICGVLAIAGFAFWSPPSASTSQASSFVASSQLGVLKFYI